MKKMIRKTVYLLLALPWFAACSDTDGQHSPQGELISVSFDDPALTRAAAGASALAENTLIKVYVYNQGSTVMSSSVPLAEGTYKVAASGSPSFQPLTGLALKLYAGTYDLYFVSYNSSKDGEVPSVGSSSSLISNLTNGKDFLYTFMKNVGIHSDVSGSKQCRITLNQPFRRLCAGLQLKVKAKVSGHPLEPTSIKLASARIENLSDTRTFLLGNTALTAPAGYTGSYDFKTFTGNDTSTGTADVVTSATPATEVTQVLPVDGTKALKVTLGLQVSYVDRDHLTHTDEAYSYEIVTDKALLAGTFYQFVFTLTFYGNYQPDKQELDILPFTDVPLDTGNIGG